MNPIAELTERERATSENRPPRNGAGGDSAPDDMEALRGRIDEIDDHLLDLLSERCRLARRIGAAKRAEGKRLVDHPREAAVVRSAGRRARSAGLDEELVRRIYWGVIELARESQGAGRRSVESSCC